MSVVKHRVEDNIYIIILNRPDKLNAFNYELVSEIERHLINAKNYDGLVITGSGRAFSAGDDIYEMYRFETLDDAKKFFNKLGSMIREVIWYPGPIVGCLNGFAVGGGAELALLLDYNIAYPDIWLWYPEYRIGVYPPILLALGPVIFGLKNTKRIAFKMEKVSVEKAMQLGIVDEVVPRDVDIVSMGVTRAKELTSIGRRSYIASRRILAMHYEDKLMNVLEDLAEAVMSPEAKQLMKGFIEKRL